MITSLSRSSVNTPNECITVARALLKRIREPNKELTYRKLGTQELDLVFFVDASISHNTVPWVRFNILGSIIGLRGQDNRFFLIQWKSAKIHRKYGSIILAELFKLDFGTLQLCCLAQLLKNISFKQVRLTSKNWLTDYAGFFKIGSSHCWKSKPTPVGQRPQVWTLDRQVIEVTFVGQRQLGWPTDKDYQRTWRNEWRDDRQTFILVLECDFFSHIFYQLIFIRFDFFFINSITILTLTLCILGYK